MLKLSEFLNEQGFSQRGSAQWGRNYWKSTTDGGTLSISLMNGSYCEPRGSFDVDTYTSIEVGFIKNGDFYNHPAVDSNLFSGVGILPYFPVDKLETLVLTCCEIAH